MKNPVLSRRNLVGNILGLSAGFLVASCSQYIPEGATPPAALSRATMLAQINATRAANGRKPLSYNPILGRAATTHARLMASRGELSHTLGGSLRERVTAAGYRGAVGENLAGGQRTLELAIKGWLESPAHRSTLLNDRFNEFGLAVASGGGAHKIYWAMILGGSFAAWQS
ncbi:MAG TPA: CAP domain-containing protein [Devosia sp.]|nr:CAP domain-containing protein [Devosia sp.]